MVDIKFNFNRAHLGHLMSIIADLYKVNKIVKIKIEGEHTSIYTVDSVSKTLVSAYKSFNVDTNFFFDIIDYEKDNGFRDDEDEIPELKLDLVIPNASVFNKKLSFLKLSDGDIKGKFSVRNEVDGVKIVFGFYMSDGKFKFSLVGGEIGEIRDISKDKLAALIDPTNSITELEIPSEEFVNGKRASEIDSDSEITTITMKNGTVFIGQDSWEMKIAECDPSVDKIMQFNKKFMKSMNPNAEFIKFRVYETFFLYYTDIEKFMISYEITV